MTNLSMYENDVMMDSELFQPTGLGISVATKYQNHTEIGKMSRYMEKQNIEVREMNINYG